MRKLSKPLLLLISSLSDKMITVISTKAKAEHIKDEVGEVEGVVCGRK